jgi:MraZ protein
MGLFLGTHINKVDKKGRVSVPSQFRLALAGQDFQGIILYPSLASPGVAEGCGMDFLESIASASASQHDIFSPQQSDLAAVIFGRSVQLAWDPEGRVVLPEPMIAHIGITEQVAFVGMGVRFQLMLPQVNVARDAQAATRLQQDPPKLILNKPGGS